MTTLLLLSPFVVTDARKFLKMGVWRSLLRVLLIILHVAFRLPVPPRTFFRTFGRVAAFFVPHFDLHKVNNESYLNRCGASTRVVNRGVSVDKTACIPAGLTRIVTLGVSQWCPE